MEPLVNSVVGALLKHPGDALKAGIEQFEGGVAAAQANDGVNKIQGVTGLTKLLEEYKALRENVKAPTAPNTNSPLAVYKARPLNGIWATAPYLHNGSVPNLYELLLPMAQRSESFYLGSREFDPIQVGYVSEHNPAIGNDFKYDSSKLGNSNSGHEYGTELDDTERQQLVEYMKTL